VQKGTLGAIPAIPSSMELAWKSGSGRGRGCAVFWGCEASEKKVNGQCVSGGREPGACERVSEDEKSVRRVKECVKV
jgi:hypothetical protein